MSYKGGAPGFVRVVEPRTLAFPSYDGNGMFRSQSNLRPNDRVGLLFIGFEQPQRLRMLGRAVADVADPLRAACDDAQRVVRVHVEQVFPNCPRCVHRMQRQETSPYVPCAGRTSPVPAWKRFEVFRDVLPAGNPARDPGYRSFAAVRARGPIRALTGQRPVPRTTRRAGSRGRP